jgi:hypothetical protein
MRIRRGGGERARVRCSSGTPEPARRNAKDVHRRARGDFIGD